MFMLSGRMWAVGELFGDAERDSRRLDLLLRPNDALGKRCLGHQKGCADLGRRQAPDHSKGKRHLSVAIECWVTAQQQKTKAFIFVSAESRTSLFDAIVLRFINHVGHPDIWCLTLLVEPMGCGVEAVLRTRGPDRRIERPEQTGPEDSHRSRTGVRSTRSP